jgi:competence protein CoiA
MQLYALDEASSVLASHAQRDRDYTCPECSGPVRCRGGQKRQSHFYHVRSLKSCSQHGKSLAHLQIQLHLKSVIPSLYLEKRVDDRIADTLWEEEKIVFEIQCSPMSIEEAKSRVEDYSRRGYAVVWILHDRRFNRKRLTPMEKYVRTDGTAFFTDGRRVYDQFDVCVDARRPFRGFKLPVDLSKPRRIPWGKMSFQGDFLHWSESHDVTELKKLARRHRKKSWWKLVYKFLIYRVLEGSTL